MTTKLPKGTLDKLWSKPAHWRGPFYYCKDDPRTVVPKRLRSFGWTPNFAHASAWIGLVIGIGGTAGVALIVQQSGRNDLIFPVLALLVAFSLVNGWYRSSPKRYEEGN